MSPDDMDPQPGGTAGMRVMFWTWAGLIGAGLAVMILTPLGGR
ncbi:hypothetical protein [Microbacterium sp. SZ1]|nr:hypothetical protein [Microbacterium sp. SZ1]